MKLCIPEKTIQQHVVMLGKTGAGKSSALRHIVEHLLDQQKRVCVIDPKGDWWGLKSSADGKAAGYPVIMFGDFKNPQAQDVPINEHSGAHVAELVASGNRPCVIGLRGWMPAAMTRFWIDFATALFNANAGELNLVIDEVHNFAPKAFRHDGDAAKALNRTNRLLAEGRGIGIVCLVASQRPQKVHNDTLTSCETLVAMRVVHAADRTAIKEWIDGCGDKDQGKNVLATLAQLSRGEGWVWSPESGFGPERVKFPMFTTFDSFAPPQLQKRVSGRGWSTVDLTAVREKLAAAIKEAKENDPKELRAEISRLKLELLRKPKPAAAAPTVKIETQIIDRPVFAKGEIDALKDIFERTHAKIEGAEIIFRDVLKRVQATAAAPASAPKPALKAFAPRPRVPAPRIVLESADRPDDDNALNGQPAVDKCARAILAVLDNYRTEGCAIDKLALLAGYRITGGFRNSLSMCRVAGAIVGENTGVMHITPHGSSYGPFPEIPTGQARIEFWKNHRSFDRCAKAIFAVLLEAGGPLGMEDIAAKCSPPYQVTGGFRNSLSMLRTAGVIVGRNTEAMSIAPAVFE